MNGKRFLIPVILGAAIGSMAAVALPTGAPGGTPVDGKDYQAPFRFTGTLNKLTVELKPSTLSHEQQRTLETKGRRNNAASE